MSTRTSKRRVREACEIADRDWLKRTFADSEVVGRRSWWWFARRYILRYLWRRRMNQIRQAVRRSLRRNGAAVIAAKRTRYERWLDDNKQD